jgi:hypothetical protein
MAMVATRILREEWEVLPRLLALGLELPKLLNVRRVAIAAAADATPFHPANAAGTFSYQHGTFSLRNEHCGVGAVWSQDWPNGVEAIKNEAARVKIVFANVDIACDDRRQPKPRSDRGAGSQRLCSGNDLFGDLQHFAPARSTKIGGWTVYYLMVAPNAAVELSCATVENNTFAHFFERIYLSDGSDLDGEFKLTIGGDDDGAAVVEFDPKVDRKI